MGDDHHRAESRFRAALPAWLHGDGDERLACTAEDLSRSGVLLVGPLPEPAEPDVRLTVATPAGDVRLELDGRVVHVGRTADGQPRLGVAFVCGGRCRVRTCDPCRVKAVLYR